MHEQILNGLVEKCLKNRSTDCPNREYITIAQLEEAVAELSVKLAVKQESIVVMEKVLSNIGSLIGVVDGDVEGLYEQLERMNLMIANS